VFYSAAEVRVPMPTDIGVIDTMMGIPGETSGWYEFLKPLLLDEESRERFKMPAQYMFKDIPNPDTLDDPIAWTVQEMDRRGVARAMLGMGDPKHLEAARRFPDRFFLSYNANPNLGMDELRTISRLHAEVGIKAITSFPAGLCPQVPIDDRKWYPVYARCVDLGLPICITVGVPGPRIPMAPQKVELLDEVCWFFPELKVVMRHGGEPWVDLAVKLMLKYPNLHYSTSAFAPRHYPKEIVDFANTRGSRQVMYAGYFPMGLSLERIFRELPEVPLRDHVWPLFLRDNAKRVFDV
jgi:predicted TIM-barrel fold metal-dependent hydrolase